MEFPTALLVKNLYFVEIKIEMNMKTNEHLKYPSKDTSSKFVDSQVWEKQRIGLPTMLTVIDTLYQEEVWLCLYSKKRINPDYIQIHSQTDDEDALLARKEDASPFLSYLAVVEARVYDEKGGFKHYRIFSKDRTYIHNAFRAYYLDEYFDYSDWLDVSDEFK